MDRSRVAELILEVTSVTGLGDFSNFLVPNCIAKVVQIFGDDLGYFVRHPLQNENCYIYFLGNTWRILGYFLLQHLVTLHTTHQRHLLIEIVVYT